MKANTTAHMTATRRRPRTLLAAATITALAALTVPALTVPAPAVLAADTQMRDDTQLLLVHGYGDSDTGTDCNGSTWKNALRYYQDAGGRSRSSMTTIGYYAGDKARCDAMIGDGAASTERPIQALAKDLASYIDAAYTSKGQPVDIVAHSMGGLITRVALLGSAQGWKGFPAKKLNVDNVVTLSTPHQGIADPAKHSDRQWRQMNPDSGFLRRLHEKGSGLGDKWADGTDWSLVGSAEDATVSYRSGIDKGNYADQKYGYQDDPDDSGQVTHTGVRTLYGQNKYELTYSRAAGDKPPKTTDNGWSPLKTAFQAATKVGDGLPI
jgi:pimeloyl-ACP methyl ester carboxylesterase